MELIIMMVHTSLRYAGDGISVTTDNQNLNSYISIYNNNITDNARFGIKFNGATSNSSIFNNNITNNGVGINLSNLALRVIRPLLQMALKYFTTI